MSDEVTITVGSSVASVDLVWVRGDAHVWEFTMTDDAGDPIDISGSVFYASMSRRGSTWDFVPDVSAGNGVLRLAVPTDADLPRRGRWDLRQAGPVTLIRGTVKLLPEVTEVPAA